MKFEIRFFYRCTQKIVFVLFWKPKLSFWLQYFFNARNTSKTKKPEVQFSNHSKKSCSENCYNSKIFFCQRKYIKNCFCVFKLKIFFKQLQSFQQRRNTWNTINFNNNFTICVFKKILKSPKILLRHPKNYTFSTLKVFIYFAFTLIYGSRKKSKESLS